MIGGWQRAGSTGQPHPTHSPPLPSGRTIPWGAGGVAFPRAPRCLVERNPVRSLFLALLLSRHSQCSGSEPAGRGGFSGDGRAHGPRPTPLLGTEGSRHTPGGLPVVGGLQSLSPQGISAGALPGLAVEKHEWHFLRVTGSGCWESTGRRPVRASCEAGLWPRLRRCRGPAGALLVSGEVAP